MPAPEQPPESVVLQSFAGLKNTVSPERLLATELEAAVNVDIDDTGQVRRRRGYTLKLAGSFHSLYDRMPGKVFGVKNNALGLIRPNFTFFALTPASSERVSYTTVADKLYFSSRTHSGIIDSDDNHSAWGAVSSEATWVSPVVNPTSTMGAVRGRMLGAPPMATEIAAYNGRIYLAQEKMLWATEYLLYNYVDKTRNFIQFEHDITMLAAMYDGLYVGTEGGLYFLRGDALGKLKQTCVTTDQVLPGSAVWVPADQVNPGARQGPVQVGEAVVFMTSGGVVAGFDGGTCFNLTQGRVVFPTAQSAAGLYRQDSGTSAYIVVADSGGTPSANARIGDHVEAEIIRFQG